MLWTDLFVLYYLAKFLYPIEMHAEDLFRGSLVSDEDVVIIERLFNHEWTDPWIC